MRFWKYHALGNDYLVMDEKDLPAPLTVEQVKVICHRNFGVGSDGILLLIPSTKAPFGLRIYNPDGSQAEKSGNGLRIFNALFVSLTLSGLDLVRGVSSYRGAGGAIVAGSVRVTDCTFARKAG